MRIIILIAGLLITGNAFSQTIPNAGFETWATSGPFFAPTGWAVSPGVHQSNQMHSGSWAVQCTVDTFTNPGTSTLDTVVGTAYSGAMTMGPPIPGANLNGYAFTSRPDTLTGFTKFHAMGPDSFRVSVTLSYWDTTTHARHAIAQATFTSGINDSVYKRFSTPLQYTSSSIPDTCVIQITAANPQAPRHMGTSVWVDDMAFANHSTTSVDEVTTNNNFVVYPNPFTDVINICESGKIKMVRAQLFNIQGQEINNTSDNYLNTADFASGAYILRVTSNDGQISTQGIIKK